MLEIDERRDNNKRNKNPVGERDLPGKGPPNREEKKCRDQFDTEITKSDSASAVGAASP